MDRALLFLLDEPASGFSAPVYLFSGCAVIRVTQLRAARGEIAIGDPFSTPAHYYRE
jgi:hypothetical protein